MFKGSIRLVGPVFIILVTIISWPQFKFLLGSKKATAKITQVFTEGSACIVMNKPAGSEDCKDTVLQVEYTTKENEVRKSYIRRYSRLKDYSVGTVLQILYNNKNPEKIARDDFIENYYFAIIIVLFIALTIISLATDLI